MCDAHTCTLKTWQFFQASEFVVPVVVAAVAAAQLAALQGVVAAPAVVAVVVVASAAAWAAADHAWSSVSAGMSGTLIHSSVLIFSLPILCSIAGTLPWDIMPTLAKSDVLGTGDLLLLLQLLRCLENQLTQEICFKRTCHSEWNWHAAKEPHHDAACRNCSRPGKWPTNTKLTHETHLSTHHNCH